MSGLSGQLRDWLARAEVLARGIEYRRQQAVDALSRGRPWDARHEAIAMLEELPHSPIALLLWADAAEAMMLDHEVVEALERLAEELPFRADVWLRLAMARQRLGTAAHSALERAAHAPEPIAAADDAKLRLVDAALARRDLADAQRWLDELGGSASRSPDVARRRARLLADRGDIESAAQIEQRLPDPTSLDADGWLLRGRVLAAKNPAAAAHALARALLLDAPDADRIVSGFVLKREATELSASLIDIARTVGRAERPMWRAALARLSGREQDALAVLAESARSTPPDVRTAADYLELALELRRPTELEEALALANSLGAAVPDGAVAIARALQQNAPERRLETLGAVAHPWAEELRDQVYAEWLPMAGKASFDNLFFELATLARELGDPAVFGMLEALARDLQLPLRAVVLGEFNAGKSTFINALLGESVVPTGIVPTTATLNRLVWSSERSVRIEQRSLGPDVLLAHSDLRAALANMNPALVDRVTVHAPLDLLRTVEIIDTPGFNSLDPAHSAVARRGIAGAQIALWVLDATQPFKDSERVIASEIAQRKLPTLVLVNKADRISDADRPAIVDHLRQALRLTGLTPANTPILFAAKLALAGLKGDASALAASGWESVRGALADLLVARSSAVRDATLRRELAAASQRLEAIADQRVSERRARDALAKRQNELLADLARSIEIRRDAAATQLGLTIERECGRFPPLSRFADPAARRLVTSRARTLAAPVLLTLRGQLPPMDEATWRPLEARLAPRLAALLAALAPPLLAAPPQAPPMAGAAASLVPPLASAAAVFDQAFGPDRVGVLAQLSALIMDELGAAIDESRAAPSSDGEAAAELRIRALVRALTVSTSADTL